ncbi:MAG: hypothetical protein FWH50_00360 [Coriobacteriia bacterium]|nr:hypothetical protein [Coriobacteriia bacterium]
MAGIWWYASHSAYLIAEDGQVVIYRGLVGDVFGFRLQWREADTGIKVDDLDAPLPDRLRQGIQLGSLDDAEKLVRQYQQQIDRDKP